MKKKELNNLRAKDLKELLKMSDEKHLELSKIKVEMSTSKEKNLKKVKNLRREIAQVATVLREKQISEKELKGEGKEES